MPKLQMFKEYASDHTSSTVVNGFGQIGDLVLWMREHGVPWNAEIVYAGCGSHNIAFEWYVEVPDPPEQGLITNA